MAAMKLIMELYVQKSSSDASYAGHLTSLLNIIVYFPK